MKDSGYFKIKYCCVTKKFQFSLWTVILILTMKQIRIKLSLVKIYQILSIDFVRIVISFG